jgi:competence protein ComEA
MKFWQALLLGLFVGLLAAAIILLVSAPPRGQPIILKAQGSIQLTETSIATPKSNLIGIHVVGEVKVPGLVLLPEGSRVSDAILSAGGMTDLADENRLNLAALLEDGTRVYVPAKGETLPDDITATLPSDNHQELININLADREELDSLPGIGLAKADAIIDYRTSQGDFLSIEEILKVPGIGESIFTQIKDLIKVGK